MDFSGDWEILQQGQPPATATFRQRGNSVEGDSRLRDMTGRHQGYLTGNVFDFSWEAAGYRGTGRYTMCAGGDAFYGRIKVGNLPGTIEQIGRRTSPGAGTPAADPSNQASPNGSVEDLLKQILTE
ncbi:hypothetical protein ACFL2T_00840 [Elusimicrobiota bacterium]